MENTLLILSIVTTILLGGVSFFTFQLWLMIKELKLVIPRISEDLRVQFKDLKDEVYNLRKMATDNLLQTENKLAGKIDSNNEIIFNVEDNLTKILDKKFMENLKIVDENEKKCISEINNIRRDVGLSIQKLDERIEKVRTNQVNIAGEIKNLYNKIIEPLEF
ncbi:MAG: hypothetical protein L6Q47_07315 [Ignavibacteriaceae bacterium]|nr:hypothetical protein [Ignavibacteriaceae bacterium]